MTLSRRANEGSPDPNPDPNPDSDPDANPDADPDSDSIKRLSRKPHYLLRIRS